MPDPEDPAEAAARLETALERIAARADRTRSIASAPAPAPEPVAQAVDTQAIASRLDFLIARLRSALATDAGSAHERVATNIPRPAADEA